MATLDPTPQIPSENSHQRRNASPRPVQSSAALQSDFLRSNILAKDVNVGDFYICIFCYMEVYVESILPDVYNSCFASKNMQFIVYITVRGEGAGA